MFKKIKSIITLEHTKDLNLETYTIDFETGLMNSLGKVFNKIRAVGCYYHYLRNIFKESKKLKINKISKFKEIQEKKYNKIL